MAKGENIFKRKDGRWEARYPKGRTDTGRLQYGFCYGKTYKEAKEKAAEARVFLVKEPSGESKTPVLCFAAYCDAWLESKRPWVKTATYIKYESILAHHIKPELGARSAEAISTASITAFSRRLLEEKRLSPKTVRDILTVLKLILRDTSAQLSLPPLDVPSPKLPKSSIRVLTRAEQARLVSYLLSDWDTCKFGVFLALLTGLRIGELCALRWEDISLESGTMRVHATMQRLRSDEGAGKTKVLIGSPKSDASLRTIPLTSHVLSLCQGMQGPPTAYILTGTEKHMEPRTLQYRFKRYTKDCRLEDVHFHTLRHTFATRCVEAGFEIKSLSEILGHSNTSVTLNRYVHSSLELKRANMERLNEAGM